MLRSRVYKCLVLGREIGRLAGNPVLQ